MGKNGGLNNSGMLMKKFQSVKKHPSYRQTDIWNQEKARWAEMSI